METLSLILITLSIAFFVILACYPLVVHLKYILSSNKVDKSTSFLTPVSIIIACYNEEEYIRDKIESIIDENEWVPGSELIIVSSGATDNTNVILDEYANNKKIITQILPVRLSKIDGVNLAVTKSQNEILVFSDCRQKTKSGSIKNLIHNFNDPKVGTVTGTLIDTKNASKPSFFRSLFNSIAIEESAVSSCLNVYGALYAQRKSIFKEIPRDLLFDDLFVVVSTLSQNKRLIQDELAIIYDVNFNQYYRKERISRLVRGLLLLISNHFILFKSIPTRDLFRFLIYKYFKLLMPFILALLTFGLAIVMNKYHDKYLYIGFLVITIAPFLFNRSRNFIILLLRINYYFMISVLLYLFGIEQSNQWDKLAIKK